LEWDGTTNRSVFGYQYPNQSPALFLQYNGDGGNFFPAEQWSEKGNATSTGYYLESLQNNGEYGFGPTGSEDTCISRGSAGKVAIGVCGSPGDANGSLVATNSNFSGTVSAGSETLGSPLLPASGGTGATTAAGALANLGGAPLAGAAFTGPVTAPNVTDSALTSGNCVQAGTVGLLSTAAKPCYSLGGTLTSANVALGAGAGTGASVAGVYGNDGNHLIDFTTGTAPATNEVIFTVTLTAPRSSTLNPICQWNEVESGTYFDWTSLAQIPMFSARLATSTTYVFESNTVALPAGTPMSIAVSCP
jgi:hypothetical protein